MANATKKIKMQQKNKFRCYLWARMFLTVWVLKALGKENEMKTGMEKLSTHRLRMYLTGVLN
jgi:hypothetical protein